IIPDGYDPASAIGTGPFKLTSFNPGRDSAHIRFDGYWDKVANIDGFNIINFADDNARVNALLAGQVDVINSVPTTQVSVVEAAQRKILVTKGGQLYAIYMRCDMEPFNDPRVRQAFRLIANRPQILQQ